MGHLRVFPTSCESRPVNTPSFLENPRALLAPWLLVATALALAPGGDALPVALAQPAATPPPAAADVIIARVGDSVITERELVRRMQETPRPTLATYGSTEAEIRRNFLERELVRDALFAEEAKSRGFDRQKDVRDRLLGVLRTSLIGAIRDESGVTAGVTDEEVRDYYQANLDKFVAPKRIGIARILVASEEEARALIAELGAGPVDANKWKDLARERSLDKSSNLRGGNLGLVKEDGTTSQPDKRVDPAMFAAADKVEDGTLLPDPIKEGARFAVVWKRQTMRSAARSIDAEAPTIRATIADDKMRSAVGQVLDRLRAELVSETNPELIGMVAVGSTGEVDRALRPGVLPRTKRKADPSLIEGPAGLR